MRKWIGGICFFLVVITAGCSLSTSAKDQMNAEFEEDAREILHLIDESVERYETPPEVYGKYNDLLNNYAPYGEEEKKVIDQLGNMFEEGAKFADEPNMDITDYMIARTELEHLLDVNLGDFQDTGDDVN